MHRHRILAILATISVLTLLLAACTGAAPAPAGSNDAAVLPTAASTPTKCCR